MAHTPQIPFDFFEPESPDFNNFVVGDNGEALSRLRSVATQKVHALTLWGGQSVGKTHLLSATASAATHVEGRSALLLRPTSTFPADPFVEARILCIDDTDRLTTEQQGWLFTAFNHVAQMGGITISVGKSPPAQWPVRDDLRTRMGSGLIYEILPIPQDSLAPTLAAYASSRGFSMSNEVLTYILSHSRRDIASLCQTLAGLDRLSLSLKRAVTIPLVREYLSDTLDARKL
jgi:DnaA-homolog protein